MPKIQTILPKLYISVLLLFSTTPVKAQITPDNTLGAERSAITPNSLIQSKNINADLITGGAQRGRNLFHSFSDFNVSDGQRVYFANPSDVTNILTRVTGGNRSNILGTLGVDGTANLFLINPAGIFFGKNATLDLRGSFVGTTANGVQFGNLGSFSATNPQAPPLLTIDPSGLLFNQLNQQGITVTNQSLGGTGVATGVTNLQVPSGKSLLLVGGDVTLDGGSLRASGGRVELASLAAPGTIGLNVAGDTLSLSVPNNVQRSNISLQNQARVDVQSAGGGDIAINARNLNITNGSVLAAGIASNSGNVSTTAGNIDINATDTVTIDGSSPMSSSTGIVNGVTGTGNGNAGNIFIGTNFLNIIGNAQVGSFTNGQGNAGNVTIQATDTVSFSGTDSAVLSSVGSSGAGNGGDIIIQARLLSLSEGTLIGTGTFGRGNAGNIKINVADSVSLNTGAVLNTTTYGQGNAGNVIINATKSVSLDGNGSDILSAVGVPNDSQNNLVKGNGGNIQITTEQLSLSNGAAFVASTYGQGSAGNVIINATKSVSLDNKAFIFSNVGDVNNSQNNLANGNSGNIQITTDQLSLTNGAQLAASTLGQGNAGNVIINATKGVSLDGSGSLIFSNVGDVNNSQNNLAKGNSGNIQITTDQLSLTNGAQLAASTLGQGNAGNVIINATKGVSLDGSGSDIFNTVGAVNNSQNNVAFGKGGNIQITTDQLSLSKGAGFIASTYGQGDAGKIILNVSSLGLTGGAQLDDQTLGQGNAGDVIVNATKSVSLDGNGSYILSTVGAVNSSQNNIIKGNGGNIQITTDQLSLTKGAQLVASTYGQGNAGNVIIDATKSVSLDGSGSAIFSAVGAVNNNQNNLAIGKGGNIQITTEQLSLTKGTQLVASTLGQGNAGNVIIDATKSVSLDGLYVNSNGQVFSSAIFSSVGDVYSNQNNVATGKGGDIQITTEQLSLTNGAALEASTYGQGNAGNVIINASSRVSLDGQYTDNKGVSFHSGVRSAAGAGNYTQNNMVKGNGGSIQINTGELSLTNGAALDASTFGPSNAGDLEIIARSIRLDKGAITATTNLGNGGNIKLTAQDYILLRNGSKISTNAGTTNRGGNGGNITINSPFIVAVPNENSDITANAFSGSGGQINISAELFGIEPRQQVLPPTNDITASSQLGVQGQINVTQPQVDLVSGLVAPPVELSDATTKFSQLCPNTPNPKKKPLGSFVITGKGSIPPSPLELLPGRNPDIPLANAEDMQEIKNIQAAEQRSKEAEQHKSKKTKEIPSIVEAQGIVQTPDGQIYFVANAHHATPSSQPTASPCPSQN